CERAERVLGARVLEEGADACRPVFGGGVDARRAVVDDAAEVARGAREVAGEVANPAGTPACFARHRRARQLAREAIVGLERVVVVSGFLLDPADRVPRLGRVARRREAAGELAVESRRSGVVVVVPPPPRGRRECLRPECRRERRDLETRGLGIATLSETALGTRANPERLRAVFGRRRGGEHGNCLERSGGGIVLAEQ